MSTSLLRLVWIYPDLLSTYGDRGNLLILAHRAESRRILTESITVRSDRPIPREGDIYLIGGGEDGAQALAAEKLIADGALNEAAGAGKVVFAVCAGYQLLGESFVASGQVRAGLGLFDMRSDRDVKRAVGELSGEVNPKLGLEDLTGFENHGGRTHLGPATMSLSSVTHGIGNDGSTEGAWSGKMVGTYLHGPALARNPGLADQLLAWAIDRDRDELPELDDSWIGKLRAERFAALAPA
ncbi:type 1 glutamine amidotransferase [Stackebrandtia nassauensis]|uniref:Lipid II isoglutaminyl synthase (glutamine-hydrolyzing) subunit GatD n=1 Tax=Stackebrandtia nassauensis (strain DSM 44728 / CIP 108903 / NRRL B-16338 / NBRC 102104 / LLR-40K-21) TaxID=446470 RepID=D3Q766_STANL|nr:glutamine amidotransferase [Stackebrandtia nassauensis]ADD42337.1 CobB/CobQ domain protein glutamine amidotransferase [Stackebrandtia nassauensis DSM 44728]